MDPVKHQFSKQLQQLLIEYPPTGHKCEVTSISTLETMVKIYPPDVNHVKQAPRYFRVKVSEAQ